MPTEYETGVWYDWNGGECPVHPETVVETRHLKSGSINNSEIFSWVETATEWAGWFSCECWAGVDDDENNPIVAFRIVEPYVPPLEVWIPVYAGGHLGANYNSKDLAVKMASGQSGVRVALFREVTEGGDT